MDEAPKKGNPSLSIDRAAFLLLRVKKAFKRKRQQRKDKLAAQQAAAGVAAQTRSSRKGPPPLLRSRTLPAIVVPGISILHAQVDSNRLSTGDSTSLFGARWSLQPKTSRASLLNDDISLEYRRKSSGSTNSGQFNNNGTDPYIYACDDYERHADGTVVLRIPAPHVVAARAYRMSVSGNSGCSSSISNSGGIFNIPQQSTSSSSSTVTSGLSSVSGIGAICNTGGGGINNIGGTTGSTNIGTTNNNSNNNSSGTTNTALYRLARLLNQTAKTSLGGGRQSPTLKDDTPRRLSWERRVSKLPRSSSIDSMVEAVWNDSPRPSLDVPRDPSLTFNQLPLSSSSNYNNNNNNYTNTNKLNNNNNNNNQPTIITTGGIGYLPQQPSQLSINYGSFSGTTFVSRRESLLSPSSGRRTKQNRGIVGKCQNNEKKTPLTDCILSPTVMLRQKSFLDGIREKRRQIKSEILPSEINLPDLITRSSIQPALPIPPHLPTSSSIKSTKSKQSKSNNCNLIVTEIQRNFRLKSPLFNNNNNKSKSVTKSIDMEFLVPSQPITSDSRQHDNTKESTKEQHEEQFNSDQNGKIFLNANGFHILSNHNHINHNHNHNMQQQQHLKKHQEHKPTIDNKYEQQQNINLIHNYEKDTGVIFKEQQKIMLQHEIMLNNNKMTKKQLKLAQAQLDKLTQINIHLHALFSAVEHGHLEKARTILESTDVDVNSLNSDGLSPLDVAVLSNNRSMTKMLLQHGAMEGSQFKIHDSLGNHLNGLLHDAENRIQDLSGSDDLPQLPFSTRASFSSIIGNSGPSVTGCTGTEADKQLGLWERRVKGLRRMLLGWDQARPPDYPSAITVDVAGPNSVSVCILEPLEGPITTKFKVQWSTRADFSNIVGEREIIEWTSYQGIMGATCRITELTQGRRYFFRSNSGNVKGWGPFKNSIPSSVIPSSWRDMDNRENRFAGRQRILDDLFTAVRLARPGDASELSLDKNNGIQRRNPKKKTTIKQLFSAASKFQKNLRRGIFLACILYFEDKILVTNEDFIPAIEIDETYPSSLHTDYHWLMKVACTWDDVKSLRTDMERNSTSAVHFRTKLLSSACQMQSALCISDLGQLYHKPLRDSHGTIVLSCVNSVKSPKSISVLNSRWVPLNKIQKKVTALHEDNNINEILISSIAEQINYHQTSSIRLTRGLYLGYLKMQSSVEQIQIVVPTKTPNVLPHCRIRDNPHISAEEWGVLKGEKTDLLPFRPKSDGKSEVQKLFLEAITIAVSRLFTYMNIIPEEALAHRLYDIEVIELSPDVSFLIVCPPFESSCAVPGQREILLQRGDLLSLPIQAFEMVHLRTYQNSIIQKYSRLSCILELDTALANHSHREAFSTLELQTAKERLAKLQELTTSLNTVWKGVRWLMDVIAYARDRNCNPTISMREILEYSRMNSYQDDNDIISSSTNLHLLQLPQRDNKLMKSSPGRGSWPGPAASNNFVTSGCFLGAEHSKSEQNLGMSVLTPGYLSINSGMADSSSRKNSADSQSGHSYFSAGEGSGEHIVTRLPPSRSEDTLVLTKKNLTGLQHRKRATSSVNNASVASAIISSPHIIAKAAYKGTTDSLQSLSSDSDSFPVASRNKTKIDTSVVTIKEVTFLKPILNVLQSEIKNFKEPLHISEPSSPCTERPIRISINRHSDDDGDEDMLTAATSISRNSDATPSTSSGNTITNIQPGIIQVYAAYDTGLANGTSLKLHVTPKTTAREVVDLVVKQLNMAVVLKGKEGPIYTADKLKKFCLVAVIGARERCLRDDFKPLQLQNPWKKGKLYVRQKQDLLAAIEHSNREAHLI